MLRDLYNSTDAVQSLASATRTADADGTGVDLALHSAALVVFDFGTSGDTLSGSVYIEGKLEESDDDSTYTAVDSADILGTLPTVDDPSEDDTVHTVGYIGDKRYVRAVFDLTGTHTNGIPCSATIVRAFPRYGQTEPV